MNLTDVKLSPEIFGMIHAVHDRDWDAFFKSLAEQELAGITQMHDADLPKLKARITVLADLRTLFTLIKKTKPE